MRKYLAALTCFFLFSCYNHHRVVFLPPEPNLITTPAGMPIRWRVKLRVVIAPDAEMAWMPEINAAMLHWNAVVGREMFVRTATAADVLVKIAPISPDSAGLTGCFYDATTGEINKAIIGLSPGLETEIAYRVMVHEFGHVLGLAHDQEDRLSAMYPIAHRGAWVLQPEDATYIRKMYR